MREEPAWTIGGVIGLIVSFTLWALVSVSIATHNPADAPGHSIAPHNETATNLVGPVGAWIADQATMALGIGVWVVLGAWALMLFMTATGRRVTDLPFRIIGITMIAVAVGGLHAMLMPALTSRPEGAGGVVAIVAVDALRARFGSFTAVWLLVALSIGALVAFDRWVVSGPKLAGSWVARRAQPAIAGVGKVSGSVFARPNDVDDDQGLARAVRRATPPRAKKAEAEEATGRARSSRRAAAPTIAEPDDDIDEEAEDEYETDDVDAEYDDEDEYGAEGSDDEDIDDGGEDDDAPGAPQVFDADELRDKIAKLPVRFAGASRTLATAEDLDALRHARQTEEHVERTYLFPGLDLLEDPDTSYDEKLEAYVREQAEALERALTEYNIRGEVAAIESGPVITLYQVRLAPGTKVAQVQAIASDLARSLKAVNIRVVPNTEGLDTVGIEVPNRVKERVRIKELMSRHGQASKMKLPLFLGKDAAGEPLIVDLASLPHLLIAGTTGSGKSVCMNAIIMGFLYTQKPTDLKLAMVDPKMVELSLFRDIPHLMTPVITEMSKAAAILEWAVEKMDERYELLAAAGCRDIASYNALSWEEKKERLEPRSEVEEARIPRKLPYMVFIVDELADLMMTHKEVEHSIVRIAQKARAVGMHLILATQRPQANVVTGLIKSNMPGRICFKVASGMDSRIVLDQKGGELLLGGGDLLMLTPRSSRATRAQGTLVDDSETRRVVRFIKQHSEASFDRQLLQLGDEREVAAADADERFRAAAQEDPLFDKAVEIIIESGRGSVSLLQRRLAIGYTRSSRLIEMMGEAGILGKHKGTVARDVVMTIEEWDAIKALALAAEPADKAQPELFDVNAANGAAARGPSHADRPAPGDVSVAAAAGGDEDEREEVTTSGASGTVVEEEEEVEVGDEAEDADAEGEEEDDDEYEYEYVYVDDDGEEYEEDDDEEDEDAEAEDEWEEGDDEEDEEEAEDERA